MVLVCYSGWLSSAIVVGVVFTTGDITILKSISSSNPLSDDFTPFLLLNHCGQININKSLAKPIKCRFKLFKSPTILLKVYGHSPLETTSLPVQPILW